MIKRSEGLPETRNRKRKGGKPEVLSVAIIAKLIIPEYGDDKKKKKGKKGGKNPFESLGPHASQ